MASLVRRENEKKYVSLTSQNDGLQSKKNELAQISNPPRRIPKTKNELAHNIGVLNNIQNKILINKLIPTCHHDKLPTSNKIPTSSSSAISKLSLLNKAICARQYDTQNKSGIGKKASVTVIVTKPDHPSQNTVLNNNNNNNDNNNKENNHRIIDTGIISFPNTTKLKTNSAYESKTAAKLQQ